MLRPFVMARNRPLNETLKAQSGTMVLLQPPCACYPWTHNAALRSDCIAGCGLLTGSRVRDIRFSSSWRPSSFENGYGTTLPERLASIALAGQNGLNKSNSREKI